LGGNLPTCRQWDKAARRFQGQRGGGPYQEPWNPNEKTQIAVRRTREEGPMRIRQASRDHVDWVELGKGVSLYDLAGNGFEWTRNLLANVHNETVPIRRKVREDDRIVVRGQRYLAPRPLSYEELDDETLWSSKAYGESSDEVGFRVVIEP
jgi:formylglycine-generating enzyme required for sulfatase activity